MKRLVGLLCGGLLTLCPHLVLGGCTASDVCEDVINSLVVSKPGGTRASITWESNSEENDLDEYRIVRSETPGTGNWTLVETVEPSSECGATWADYDVEEDIPQGNWTYAVQVFSTSGLACTIAE